MSFVGGALGGGIFYAKEAMQNPNMRANKTDQEMAVLIRNGHAQELRNEIEKLRKKGKLGSTNLSGTKYDSVKDENGNVISRTWLTAEDASDTQNELIAKHINNKINAIEAIINNNELGLSDNDLLIIWLCRKLGIRHTKKQLLLLITMMNFSLYLQKQLMRKQPITELLILQMVLKMEILYLLITIYMD